MDKRYDHQSSEARAQKRWLDEQTYAADKHDGQLYSVDTPPPTVSGALHIGHIFSYTQTDIIARYKRMAGFKVFYPFGFDDNGLPTERYIEKTHNVRPHDIGRSAFIKMCLEKTKVVEQEFQALWQRMGISADWSNTYATISPESRKISQESFIRLYKDGHIYRKYEPALYCTTCRTSVAQAELDDEEKPSTFNDIVFKAADGSELVIATTRPELLPSCVAIVYHPDDKRYQYLKGTQATVPVFGHKVPIVQDELVDPEKGTGLVMICTFGDKNDIAWFKKFDLPYRQSVGLDGRWTADTGILAGLKAGPARERILQELQDQGLLKNQKQITHAVNVHERCKKEIEYVALSQWFLNILDHKKKFIELAEQVQWYPRYMKSRYINWVENLSWDWCLSRQRYYGIPFPVWHCNACDEILLADIKDLPIDPQETQYPGSCTKCGSSEIVPDTDVMDTWNTSSLTPYITYYVLTGNTNVFDAKNIGDYLPMGMRPQAHDIIRTWAFYTIIKVWFHNQDIAWKDMVISGHVLARKGEKLSKSKENKAMSPLGLLERYPADTIRLWTASGSLGTDIHFAEDQLKIGNKLLTKLWNAFRFASEHMPAQLDERCVPKGVVNQWILHRATQAFTTFTKYFDQYEYKLAFDAVEQFFWQDFCDNYLEIIKDQWFNPDNYDAADVQETEQTLAQVGLRILQMYAPFIPHVTEQLYELLYQKKCGEPSLHQTKYADAQYPVAAEDASATMEHVLHIVATVRRLKSEHELALRTELEMLTIAASSQKLLDALQPLAQIVKGVTRARIIEFVVNGEQDMLQQDGQVWRASIKVG